VKTILDGHDQHCHLRQHLQLCPGRSEILIIPDERYFAAVLEDPKNLEASGNNLQYIDWQTYNRYNPRMLPNENTANIRAAVAHLAR